MMGYRHSLSGRLFAYFIVVILISLTFVGVISYIGVTKILEAQQTKQLNQIITGAAHQTELYLQSYERASNVLITDDSVKRFLDIDPTDSYSYITYSKMIEAQAFSNTFLHYPHINSIYVLGKHGRYVLENNYVTQYFEIADPSGLYKKLMGMIGDEVKLHIVRSSLKPEMAHSVVTLVRPLRGYSSFDFNGLVAMEINLNELSTLWEKIDIGDNGYFFVVGTNGEMLYHPNKGRMGRFLDEKTDGALLTAPSGTNVIQDQDGLGRLQVWRTSEYSGWKLVVSLPIAELHKPVAAIRRVVLLVGSLTLLTALWLAFTFSRSINRHIQVLKEGMRQTERGNWRQIPEGRRKDEMSLLIRSYNLMVNRLSEMIDKVYATELEKRQAELSLRTKQLEQQRAEFQALQLQINPHFLYNTLETINCYAVLDDSDEIREIVDAMAFMLRYATQTNLKEITVANELNHIRNYWIILKHRMEREIEIDVAIKPELLLEKMVRFTLQPLVENAFEHGFRKNMSGTSIVRINAWLDDNFMVTVEDNGVGMSQEKLSEIRVKLRDNRLSAEQTSIDTDPNGSIGLLNVHRRIQLVFGIHYGLSVDSVTGKGTKITMKLPKDARDRYFENE